MQPIACLQCGLTFKAPVVCECGLLHYLHPGRSDTISNTKLPTSNIPAITTTAPAIPKTQSPIISPVSLPKMKQRATKTRITQRVPCNSQIRIDQNVSDQKKHSISNIKMPTTIPTGFIDKTSSFLFCARGNVQYIFRVRPLSVHPTPLRRKHATPWIRKKPRKPMPRLRGSSLALQRNVAQYFSFHLLYIKEW